MSLRIIPYSQASELDDIIARVNNYALKLNCNAKFIVPSRHDREWRDKHAGGNYYAPGSHGEIAWTWQELYENICYEMKPERKAKSVISPPDHLLILNNILNNILDKNNELEAWPGIKRPGFLDILSSDIHELLNEAVRPEQLLNSIEPEQAISRLLHDAYINYLEYLNNNNLLDASQLCTESASLLENLKSWGSKYILIFTGFMSFTGSQLELVNLLKSRVKEIIIIRPEANLNNLRDAVSQLIDIKNINNDNKNNLKLNLKVAEISQAEAELEPEAIARSLSLWADDKGELASLIKFPGFDKIGMSIQAGSEEAISQAFRRYKIPFCFNIGMSIAQTLPGQILAALRALNNLLFPNYQTAMLLTQPCFNHNNNFSVFKAFRRGAQGLDNWLEYLQELDDKTAFNAVNSIKIFCDKIKVGGTPEDLMRAYYELLSAKGLWLDLMRLNEIGSEYDESLRLTASAIETIGNKVLALHEKHPDIGEVANKKLKGDEAFNYLEMWRRETFTKPPMKINGALSVYTGQPPVLASYPVWIMLNVTQKTWPGKITASPLLNDLERENIELNGAYVPSVQDKTTQREALFRRLILTGENLTIISRPQVDDKERALSETPFLHRMLDDMPGLENIKLDNLSNLKILTGSGNEYIFKDIDPKPDIFIKNSEPVINDNAINHFGASDLDGLLKCPFAWRLNKSNIYEQKLEIVTPAQWGTLAHSIWENIWREFKLNLNNNKDKANLFINIANDELNKFLVKSEPDEQDKYKEFRRFINDYRLKNRGLENFKFRFNRLINFQAGIIAKLYENNFRHVDILLEDDAQLRLNLHDKRVSFSGQCDRIEILADNNTGEKFAVITDYKHGKSANYDAKTKINLNNILVSNGLKNLKLDNLKNDFEFDEAEAEDGVFEFQSGLQLSAYALMFMNDNRYKDIKLAGVNFLGLEDGQAAGTFNNIIKDIFIQAAKKPKTEPPSIDSRAAEAMCAVSIASEIIKSGKFRPDYNSQRCRSCGLKGICRRSEFLGETLNELEEFEGNSDGNSENAAD